MGLTDFLTDTANSAVNYNFQKRLDDRNRNWQKWMSDTTYQRGVADLKAAGLNPILAAGKGFGAGQPGGGGAGSFKSGQGISQQKRLINQQIATAKALSTKHLADAKLSGESAKVVSPIASTMEEINSAITALKDSLGGPGFSAYPVSSAVSNIRNAIEAQKVKYSKGIEVTDHVKKRSKAKARIDAITKRNRNRRRR